MMNRNIQKLKQSLAKTGTHPLASFMVVSLVVAGAYVANFWFDHFFATPVELYHRAWKATAENYYEKGDLKNWKRFEHCFDNKIRTSEDAVVYVNKMLESLGDPYTSMHSPTELKAIADLQADHFVGLGVFLETIKSAQAGKELLAVKSLMPDSPARKAGVRPGDTILSINGKNSVGMSVMELKQIARARENKPTTVVVRRGSRNVRLSLVPTVLMRTNVELLSSDKRVAHIVVRDFLKKSTADKVMNVLKKTAHRQVIVLDMRNNPGGSVDECLKLAGAFLDKGHLVTLRVRKIGGGHYRETYTLKPDCLEMKRTDENGKVLEVEQRERLQPIAANRPLVILINSATASAAEMLSAALHDNHRATLLGTRSFGKGIAQAGLPLANGTVLTVTCVHYYTPAGKFIGTGHGPDHKNAAKEGIVPDITVADNASSDLQLKRAIALATAD